MKWYTVVGYYADNNQPWMEWAKAESPQQASCLAVKKLCDLNRGGVDVSTIYVVEVIEGKHKGVLCNQAVVMHWV